MIPREILKKVRRVEIRTRGLVNEVFSGEYHSVFKGRGMNFAEVREYQYGDDIRSIDWNVTARTGTPFVKVFDEERELTVMLVVDVSASGDFGSRSRMKGEVAVEICAVLAFSAIAVTSLSRVYSGVHWPSDVLGGFLLGGIILTLLIHVHRQYRPQMELSRAD